MAAAYVRILCASGEIRKFGGNVTDVKRQQRYYEGLTYEQFKRDHPDRTLADYQSLRLEYVRKHS